MAINFLQSVNIAGELEATSLDINGAADINSITIGGVALDEYIADTVGAMITGNTETNITVTYDDSDNTLNFVSVDTTYSVGDGGLSANSFSNADHSKLNAIEDSADVTDATNVNAAGAIMTGQIVDEDNMASNSAVKVASQQSIKAYVDAYKTESFIMACSDETTALTTGTAKVTFRMPYAFTLTDVRASVTTAPTTEEGTAMTVDINESGSTILSTKLTFDTGEKTTESAATAAVISDTALADDAEITIDIDSVGTDAAGAGLKVTLIGYQT